MKYWRVHVAGWLSLIMGYVSVFAGQEGRKALLWIGLGFFLIAFGCFFFLATRSENNGGGPLRPA
jgi:hypothetical protein